MDVNKRPHSLVFIVLAVAGAIVAFVVIYQLSLFHNSDGTEVPLTSQPNASSSVAGITYRNEIYGFTFSLPESWENYSIVTSTREIRDIGEGKIIARAPVILIRHPLWSEETPRQDIPIDIYSLAEWQKIQAEEYSVSAAPIPPTELGRNSKYVFALPARYNYAFPVGWEEVEGILKTKPLKVFDKENSADVPVVGQYIDTEARVLEYVLETGGGEEVNEELKLELASYYTSKEISIIRIKFGDCIDIKMPPQNGDKVRVRGIIKNTISELGLIILSCEDSSTSISAL